jgi:hypothetical protein
MATIKGIFEPFHKYVTRQLKARELLIQAPTAIRGKKKSNEIHIGSGDINVEGFNASSIRNSPAYYAYTTQKQCVIRMASGVDVMSKSNLLEGLESDINSEKGEAKKYGPESLAETWVLRGGSTHWWGGKMDSFNDIYNNKLDYRSNPQDGFGMVPPPGITDATIDTKSEDGSLRYATVNFVCSNRRQLEVLEALYMRPGYPILLEWGWDPYITFIDSESLMDNQVNNLSAIKSQDYFTIKQNDFSVKDEFFNSNSTINGINELIVKYKAESEGNYDGFVGYCKNFSWKVREDGGYNCVTEIIAHGEILESLKARIKYVTPLPTIENPSNSEQIAIDEFLYYLKSIKANLDKAGDQAVINYIGTSQQYFSLEDMQEKAPSTISHVEPYTLEGDAKRYYVDEEGNPIMMKQLNTIHSDYEQGFNEIKNLIMDVAKIDEKIMLQSAEEWKAIPDNIENYTTITDNLNYSNRDLEPSKNSNYVVDRGFDPIYEGTILKEITVEDATESFSGVSKKIFVRWDLICQIINKLITPEYKKDHALVELTYLNPHRSTYKYGPGSSDNGMDTFYLEYSLPKKVIDLINNEQVSSTSKTNKNNKPNPDKELDKVYNTLGEVVTLEEAQTTPNILFYYYYKDGTVDTVKFDLQGDFQDFEVAPEDKPIDATSNELSPNLFGRSYDNDICLMPHQIYGLGERGFDEFVVENDVPKDEEGEVVEKGGFNSAGIIDFQDRSTAYGAGGTAEYPNTTSSQSFYDQKKSNNEKNTDKRGIRQLTSFSNTKFTKYSIGGVYFNLDYLISAYEDLALEEIQTTNSLGEPRTKKRLKDKFGFHDWITTIWNGVNGACGGFYNFTLNTEHSRPNVARIIDNTFTGKSNKDIYSFSPQGLNSIARESNFQSKLDNDFASVISIAAQAPNNINSLEAMSFKAFHKNIKNRFTSTQLDTKGQLENRQANYDLYIDDVREYTRALKTLNFYVKKMDKSNYSTEMISLNANAVRLGHKNYKKPTTPELAQTIASGLEEMLLGIEARHAEKEKNVKNLLPDEEKTTGKHYIGSYRENTTHQRSAIIPITVSMTLDGISGISPLNIFKLNPDQLPFGYQDPNIVFIVKKETNLITNGQDWTTEITGYLTFLNDNPNEGSNNTLKKDQNQQNITNDLDNTSTQFPSNIRRVGKPCEACRENADGTLRPHHGWDLAGTIGGENPNIVANIEGTVTAVNTGNNPDTNGGGYGKWIEIKHNTSPYDYSFYAHLDNVIVKEGETTSPGTILGTQGTTGRSSGDHLHFEIRMTPPAGYNAQSWNTNSIPINRVAKGKGGEGWPVKTTVSTLDKYFYFTKS